MSNPAVGFNFSEEQNKDLKQMKAKELQEDLARQMREKQLQKQREKAEREQLDKKLLIENANFNPFGRAGGGAPLKDREGNTMADLSQARTDPAKYSPRSMSMAPPLGPTTNQFDFAQASNRRGSGGDGINYGSLPPYLYDASKKDVKPTSMLDDEPSFARGGNGIFGEGKV